jgi:hypothetical protein
VWRALRGSRTRNKPAAGARRGALPGDPATDAVAQWQSASTGCRGGRGFETLPVADSPDPSPLRLTDGRPRARAGPEAGRLLRPGRGEVEAPGGQGQPGPGHRLRRRPVVMDRLDEALGVGGWQTSYREIPDGVACKLPGPDRRRVGRARGRRVVLGAAGRRGPAEGRVLGLAQAGGRPPGRRPVPVPAPVPVVRVRRAEAAVRLDPPAPGVGPAKGTPAKARPTASRPAANGGQGAAGQRGSCGPAAGGRRRPGRQGLVPAGALLAHVRAAGAKAGFGEDIRKWAGPAIELAVAETRAFKANSQATQGARR